VVRRRGCDYLCRLVGLFKMRELSSENVENVVGSISRLVVELKHTLLNDVLTNEPVFRNLASKVVCHTAFVAGASSRDKKPYDRLLQKAGPGTHFLGLFFVAIYSSGVVWY
jgi:hypothetical protein